MMALLALQEDYANGRIRRERDFRDHDDDWLICRFRFSKAELLDLCTELGPVERETRRNRAGTVPSRSKYRSSPLWGKPAVSEGNVQWVTGMASDPRLFVTVNSPQGALVASKNEVVGQMNFQTEVTGFYRLCLGNHNNQFGGIRVFVNFGVIYEGFEESKREMEEGEMVLNSTLAGIEESVQKLQNQIFHMWRHYNFARMRKGKDHYLLLSNFNYVTWWSVTQSLVILLSGYLQLCVLKRLFRTDSSRPRC
ncbi:transmembrane emp24 domain-containing protein 6-like isoform X4 [Sander vitreus]